MVRRFDVIGSVFVAGTFLCVCGWSAISEEEHGDSLNAATCNQENGAYSLCDDVGSMLVRLEWVVTRNSNRCELPTGNHPPKL